MAYNVISVKVEGRSSSDFTALESTIKIIGTYLTYSDALEVFHEEKTAHRDAGGEVESVGNDRCFFIDGSNRPYKMIDVEKA